MGNAVVIKAVGVSYHNEIGVEKEGHKAFVRYQKSAIICIDVEHCNVKEVEVEKEEHKAFIYDQSGSYG
ncbi:hypothetical protein C2G38_2202468 [Gigaspora rosea]|uniref:Uncharacterized protein n=1 Tax=Gigaspora rosea TaxID=44941 RepID=A0A397UQE5_9GLOM|nr:hypothetical protein C2G38_2202468 [Gigaspora rosea]